MLTIAEASPGVRLDDDGALARATRSGDVDAADALFDRHAPVARRILARTLGPGGDVEDHLQDTFLAFFRELSGLRDDSVVRAFLVSITIRIARKELRRRRVRRILRLAPTEELIEAAGAGRGADHEGREAVKRLFAILDDLDTPSRLAFTLRYLEGLELVDVASAVGESLATVKRRLARVAPMVKARVAHDPYLMAYVHPSGDVT